MYFDPPADLNSPHFPPQLTVSAVGLTFAPDPDWHVVIKSRLPHPRTEIHFILREGDSDTYSWPLSLVSEGPRSSSETGVRGTKVSWASEPQC